jgi:phosphohistidine phosphatase
MELILWRHADAEDPGPAGDNARRLTKRGRKQAERMAEWLRERVGPEWRIVVSPAKRALETVKPLERDYEVRDSVGTAADVRSLLREANWPDGDRDVLIVGHQPTLGEAAAAILGSSEVISVRKGAMWWFTTRERDGRPESVLKVAIDPDALESG